VSRAPRPQGATSPEFLENARTLGRREVDLESILAGVARPRNDRSRAVDLAAREAVVLDRRQIHIGQRLQNLFGIRSLQRELRVIGAGIRDLDIHSFCAIAQPFEVFVAIRSVDHDEVVTSTHAIDEDVIDEAGRRIEKTVVLRAAILEPRDVVAGRALQERLGVLTFHQNLAHVRHIEESGTLSHRLMLVEDAGELHGQFPASEIDHLAAELVLDGVEGRLLESFVRHGRVKLTWFRGLAVSRFARSRGVSCDRETA
jgi:hypothetical protein